MITFHSTKSVQISPDTIEVDGDSTIRGVTKPEELLFTITDEGTGAGTVKGTMAFEGKDYGMNSGIPFIKIADRVEVTVDLKWNRVSGRSPIVSFDLVRGKKLKATARVLRHWYWSRVIAGVAKHRVQYARSTHHTTRS